jgi:histidyl-tRNA synthetase
MAVGVRFFSQRFIQKIVRYEQKMERENPSIETKPFDVYIVSHGDMTQEKMELLSDFWKSGIRADADFSNNFGATEFNI